MCRCLEKLEVILWRVYSKEYANITLDLRDRIVDQEVSSTRFGFISNQIDKKLECVGWDLGCREFRDFRSIRAALQNYSSPKVCADLLQQAMAEITFIDSEERINDDEVETGIIMYENIKNSIISKPPDKATTETDHSDECSVFREDSRQSQEDEISLKKGDSKEVNDSCYGSEPFTTGLCQAG